MARDFSGPNEHREIVQIAAIKVDTKNFEVLDQLVVFVKPKINPHLSDYFINLTKITQAQVDKQGINLVIALDQFKKFIGNLSSYSFGGDEKVIKTNCDLIKIKYPLTGKKFFNMREYFISHGIPADDYNSGSITEAFGVPRPVGQHNALVDCLSILDGLKLLVEKK